MEGLGLTKKPITNGNVRRLVYKIYTDEKEELNSILINKKNKIVKGTATQDDIDWIKKYEPGIRDYHKGLEIKAAIFKSIPKKVLIRIYLYLLYDTFKRDPRIILRYIYSFIKRNLIFILIVITLTSGFIYLNT